MKKLISIITSAVIFTTFSVKAADIGMGVSGALHFLDASGTETTRTSGERNKGSHDEAAAVPEIFIEAIDESGLTIGLSFIPTRDMGSESRSDSNSAGDTGTYTAKAELEDVFKLYTDIPTGGSFYGDMYVHLGVQHVTVATLESLNSGTSYPNKDLLGATIGLGTKGDLPYGNNLYYKGEVTYTNFETYEGEGSGNKVSANLEDYAARFSIGYKF